MFKKLSAGVLSLALAFSLLAPAGALAQDVAYAAAAAVMGTSMQRSVILTPGTQFDVGVLMDVPGPNSAVEFVMTELQQAHPNLLKTNTKKINDTALDLGDNSRGEYILAYGCNQTSGTVELVRVTYFDLSGSEDFTDTVIKVRGFMPGDSQPSSANGEMAYVDCIQNLIILDPKPWDVPDQDPTKMDGVDSSDGVAVLNADHIPNLPSTVSALKSRY